MNGLKNVLTGLQFTFAIATILTFGLEMNQLTVFISFLMLGTFLFFTFYLISLDKKYPVNKTYPLFKKRRNEAAPGRNEGENHFNSFAEAHTNMG